MKRDEEKKLARARIVFEGWCEEGGVECLGVALRRGDRAVIYTFYQCLQKRKYTKRDIAQTLIVAPFAVHPVVRGE